MTADDFRRLALSLPGAVEGAHMGHPDFRANGRIFASLHPSDATAMVKLVPEDQHEFIRAHPGVFSPAAGAWGLQGSTIVTLQQAKAPIVRAAMMLAFEAAMSKPAARPRASRPASPRRSRR